MLDRTSTRNYSNLVRGQTLQFSSGVTLLCCVIYNNTIDVN